MYEIRGTPYIPDVSGDVISKEGSKTQFFAMLPHFGQNETYFSHFLHSKNKQDTYGILNSRNVLI